MFKRNTILKYDTADTNQNDDARSTIVLRLVRPRSEGDFFKLEWSTEFHLASSVMFSKNESCFKILTYCDIRWKSLLRVQSPTAISVWFCHVRSPWTCPKISLSFPDSFYSNFIISWQFNEFQPSFTSLLRSHLSWSTSWSDEVSDVRKSVLKRSFSQCN